MAMISVSSGGEGWHGVRLLMNLIRSVMMMIIPALALKREVTNAPVQRTHLHSGHSYYPGKVLRRRRVRVCACVYGFADGARGGWLGMV